MKVTAVDMFLTLSFSHSSFNLMDIIHLVTASVAVITLEPCDHIKATTTVAMASQQQEA
jgi:pyrimidine deaminase RibD-like protein